MPPLPSFLCTFCWLPQYPPSPLRTLGTESRICCLRCWEQILDLAICWVCGEVVVRCEEAVSLGWCFWHRGCFGCLVCGERLGLGGLGEGVEGGKVELEEVPVCEGCEDGGLEGGGRDGMAQGWENVDRRDGGLGKARWERLMKSNGGKLLGRALPGAAEVQVDAEALFVGKPNLEDIVPPMVGIAPEFEEPRTTTGTYHHEGSRSNGDSLETIHTSMGDFNPQTIATAESLSYNGDPGSPASQSPVYITITDPINGPSFKPSSTKPIPRWMKQLPNGRERVQVHIPATTASAAAESEVDTLPLKDAKDVLVPSVQPLIPEEQKPLSQMTGVSATASATPEVIMTYDDRRMTMSTPPKMHRQHSGYAARTGMPLHTSGEMGVEYLKRYHLRALEERERGLQESKTSNVALERVRELGSVKHVVDRAKGMQIKEADVWREDKGEGKGQEWMGKEMLRKELNGLFRQG